MNSDFIGGFCTQTADILNFVGWVITLIKIAMPILIIVFGILDFGKAVTGGDEKVIKESVTKIGIRVVAGLIIFFIPSIVIWLFGLVNAYNNMVGDFGVCQTCLLAPWNCKVSTNAGSAY
jgi:hypothetical protein